MADEKHKCWCATIAGVVLIVLALIADTIGIGASPTFGYKQIGILVIGIILLVVGIKHNGKCMCKKEDK